MPTVPTKRADLEVGTRKCIASLVIMFECSGENSIIPADNKFM